MDTLLNFPVKLCHLIDQSRKNKIQKISSCSFQSSSYKNLASVESLVCHPSSPGSSDGYCSRFVSEFLDIFGIAKKNECHVLASFQSGGFFVNAKMDCFFGRKLKKNFAKSPGNK